MTTIKGKGPDEMTRPFTFQEPIIEIDTNEMGQSHKRSRTDEGNETGNGSGHESAGNRGSGGERERGRGERGRGGARGSIAEGSERFFFDKALALLTNWVTCEAKRTYPLEVQGWGSARCDTGNREFREEKIMVTITGEDKGCLLYTSPSPRDP